MSFNVSAAHQKYQLNIYWPAGFAYTDRLAQRCTGMGEVQAIGHAVYTNS